MPDRGLLGKTFQYYRMDRFLGQGGMAAVYQATDLRLQRPVAIKVMHPQYAAQDLFRQRFMQEARAIAALDHANIVRVLSFDSLDGELFIVMELVTGGSLREYIKTAQESGRFLDLSEVLELGIQMADALHYAHQQGLIHRDIKPDNVVLRPVNGTESKYQPILTDFGLAKLAESGDIYATDQPIGTYPYMSPEQCLAERIDHRSDIYGLGVMLYELTTLHLPYTPRSIAEAVRMHTRDPLVKPSEHRPKLNPAVERVILRCLAKDVKDRFQNAAEVARAFREIQQSMSRDAAIESGEVDPLTDTNIDSLSTQVMNEPISETPPYHTPQPVPQDQLSVDRVIIYNDNDPTISIPLTRNVLTIGRDTARDIQLNGRKVSRRHARIEKGFDGKYRIVDLGSTNGTHLGDALLIPNIAEVWDEEKTVRLADYWMRIEPAQQLQRADITNLEEINYASHVPSAPSGARFASVHPAAAPVVPQEQNRIGVVLGSTLVRVAPGSRVSLALEIVNQTKLVDHFTVQIFGIPTDWYTPPDQALYLLPGTRDTTSIEFHPPLRSTSTAGQHAFEVRVTTRAQNIHSPAVQGALEISPYYDFLADINPVQIKRRGDVELSLTNTGNIACTYNITARDKSKLADIKLTGKQFTVLPGQLEYIDLRVTSRGRQFIGTTQRGNFEVIAAPRDAQTNPKSMMAEIIVPPFISSSILIGLLMLVAICGIISALLVPPLKSFLDDNATATAVASVTIGAGSFTPTATETPLPTETPIPTETPTFTPIPSPFPTLFGTSGDICAGSPPTRLRVGLRASVTAGGVPNRLRDNPGTSTGTQIALIQPSTAFNIIGGPDCDTEQFLRWWQVDVGGLIGWMAEGENGNYHIEPPPDAGTFGNAFPNPVPVAPPPAS